MTKHRRGLLDGRAVGAAEHDARRLITFARDLNPPRSLVEVHAVDVRDPLAEPSVDLTALEPGGQRTEPGRKEVCGCVHF